MYRNPGNTCVLFYIFQCGCECIREKDKTYCHLEEVSGKLISVCDLLAYALIDDNSVELSRICQFFLDQKGLDRHEYVNYLCNDNEYCAIGSNIIYLHNQNKDMHILERIAKNRAQTTWPVKVTVAFG